MLLTVYGCGQCLLSSYIPGVDLSSLRSTDSYLTEHTCLQRLREDLVKPALLFTAVLLLSLFIIFYLFQMLNIFTDLLSIYKQWK